MIKNERQLQLAIAQIGKLVRAEKDLETKQRPATEHPRKKKLELGAVRGQLLELQVCVAEYEGLKSGRVTVEPVRDLIDLPRALIRARIASGLTQRDLAEKLQVAEQQVQRDEANDYASASLNRLKKVSSAVGISLDIPGAALTGIPPFEFVVRRLIKAGFDRGFIERRLASKTIQTRAVSDAVTPSLELAGRLTRMFGWSLSTIFGDEPLKLGSRDFSIAYKRATKVSAARLETLSPYSQYCAELLLKATDGQPAEVPTTSAALRSRLQSSKSGMTFRGILNWAWSSGIAIIPLNEPGGFHALVVRSATGRCVIVLKQADRARWSFDLLHEIGHLSRHPGGQFIRIDETGPERVTDDDEEVEASRFAAEVLIGPNADEVSESAIRRAAGSLPRLKDAVQSVAAEAGLPVDALALHTAYRLSKEGEPRFWGAAINLSAAAATDNHRVASDFLLSRIHWDRLNEVDRDILLQGLTS